MNFLKFGLVSSILVLSACASQTPSNDYMDPDGFSVKVAGGGQYPNPNIVRVIGQEQFRNILAVKLEANATNNQHPLQIEAEDVAPLLKQIKIRKISTGEIEPLFLPEEIDELSPWLIQALKSVQPSEDIVFHYPQKRGWGIIGEYMMTTGRLFIKDGSLNIIFGNIQQHYEGQWLQSHTLRMFQPGSRNQSILDGWEIVNNKQAVRADASRKDWVKISLTPELTSGSKVKTSDNTGAASSALAPKSAEERLQKLQQLKDKGLINDEEYKAKRQQILDSL